MMAGRRRVSADIRSTGHWVTDRWPIGETMSIWPITIAGHCACFFNQGNVQFWELEPNAKLASTGVCLAKAGEEYVIYSASGEPFTVDLSAVLDTTLVVRWYNPRIGRSQESPRVAGGNAATTFAAPFTGDAVLHLSREGP